MGKGLKIVYRGSLPVVPGISVGNGYGGRQMLFVQATHDKKSGNASHYYTLQTDHGRVYLNGTVNKGGHEPYCK